MLNNTLTLFINTCLRACVCLQGGDGTSELEFLESRDFYTLFCSFYVE
jgi:hypothetical protein